MTAVWRATRLKLIPQRKLRNSWIARTGDFAECCWGFEICRRSEKLRMIEGIKGLISKFNSLSFSDAKFLIDSDVPVIDARSVQDVFPARLAQGEWGRK